MLPHHHPSPNLSWFARSPRLLPLSCHRRQEVAWVRHPHRRHRRRWKPCVRLSRRTRRLGLSPRSTHATIIIPMIERESLSEWSKSWVPWFSQLSKQSDSPQASIHGRLRKFRTTNLYFYMYLYIGVFICVRVLPRPPQEKGLLFLWG